MDEKLATSNKVIIPGPITWVGFPLSVTLVATIHGPVAILASIDRIFDVVGSILGFLAAIVIGIPLLLLITLVLTVWAVQRADKMHYERHSEFLPNISVVVMSILVFFAVISVPFLLFCFLSLLPMFKRLGSFAVILFILVSVPAYLVYKRTRRRRKRKYVGSNSTEVFHLSSCPMVREIAEADKVYFHTPEQAIGAMFSPVRFPCEICSPISLDVFLKELGNANWPGYVGLKERPKNGGTIKRKEPARDDRKQPLPVSKAQWPSPLHIEAVANLPGFRDDEELMQWMGYAADYYDAGEYEKAFEFLVQSLDRMPALKPYIFYYIRICNHVTSIPLKNSELKYEEKLAQYSSLPKWRRWTVQGFDDIELVRCKWCGRYTRYIHPDVGTHGFIREANSCLFCGRVYPMPSWLWDSPFGRAYSYYRGSFCDKEFYGEFEGDYDTGTSRKTTG